MLTGFHGRYVGGGGGIVLQFDFYLKIMKKIF